MNNVFSYNKKNQHPDEFNELIERAEETFETMDHALQAHPKELYGKKLYDLEKELENFPSNSKKGKK